MNIDILLGLFEGVIDGTTDGEKDGVTDGEPDGEDDGNIDSVGIAEGVADGRVGTPEGTSDGLVVGPKDMPKVMRSIMATVRKVREMGSDAAWQESFAFVTRCKQGVPGKNAYFPSLSGWTFPSSKPASPTGAAVPGRPSAAARTSTSISASTTICAILWRFCAGRKRPSFRSFGPMSLAVMCPRQRRISIPTLWPSRSGWWLKTRCARCR